MVNTSWSLLSYCDLALMLTGYTTQSLPPHPNKQGTLSRKPGWGYFCVIRVLKEKRNLGVRFGIQLVKGISNHPNLHTSECLIRATCTSLSWALGQWQSMARKNDINAFLRVSKHALSTNLPKHLRLKSSVTSYRTNPTGPLGRHEEHRRNAVTGTL